MMARLCKIAGMACGLLLGSGSLYASTGHHQGVFGLCQERADFLFPAVTFGPYVNVVVGDKQEFLTEESSQTLTITHVGDARHVRFDSVVAIGKEVVLQLKDDGTKYCFVSNVAVLGGAIKVQGAGNSVEVISSVGNVNLSE